MKANTYFSGKTKKVNGITYVLCDQDYALSVPYIKQFHLEADEPTEDEIQLASDTFFEGDPDRLYMPFCELLSFLQFVIYTDSENKVEYLVYDGIFQEGACEEFTNEVVQKGLKLLWQFLTNLNKHFTHHDNKAAIHTEATNAGISSIWFRGGSGYYYTVWYAKSAEERNFFKNYIAH